MNDTPNWISAVGAVAQGLLALATIILSWVIWKSAGKLARAEYTRSIQESWNSANAALLQNEKHLRLSDEMFGHVPQDASPDYHAKRYIGFLYLNILEAEYLGQKAGLISDTYHAEMLTDILDPLLRNSILVTQIRDGGFSAEFVALCEARLRLVQNKPNQAPEPTAPSGRGSS